MSTTQPHLSPSIIVDSIPNANQINIEWVTPITSSTNNAAAAPIVYYWIQIEEVIQQAPNAILFQDINTFTPIAFDQITPGTLVSRSCALTSPLQENKRYQIFVQAFCNGEETFPVSTATNPNDTYDLSTGYVAPNFSTPGQLPNPSTTHIHAQYPNSSANGQRHNLYFVYKT